MNIGPLTLYLIWMPFNAFANRADPESHVPLKYDLSDLTQVDLTNKFFVLCTNMKVYIYYN